MLQNVKNFYRPSKDSYLGVLENYIDFDNTSGFVIDDIDLYYQPVQKPAIGSLFFIIRMAMLIVATEFIRFQSTQSD